MSAPHIVVAGGGAAGFFAAIACAEAHPGADIRIFEKSSHFLAKVRISGGGRCNVTHTWFEPREFSTRYPRGGRALISALHCFDAADTVSWFSERGVELKTEADGRMFPVTDSSQTVIDCLLDRARELGIRTTARCGVEEATRLPAGGFELVLSTGEKIACDKLLLATGGCRVGSAGHLAQTLGHTLEPPVSSLFTFHIETAWLRKVPGVSVEHAEASIPAAGLRERGPLLVTHWGLSGPVILRLSAWGARALHALDYHFSLHINWTPHFTREEIARELQAFRSTQPGRLVANTPLAPLPARLWEQLVLAAGVAPDTRWARLSRQGAKDLEELLTRTELPVSGKSLNKDEFVTCGGVRLREVNFKTMESRLCPGLYFAGELLDIDGITGGFNFQAAWTTGWIAGRAMAGADGLKQG